MPTSAQAHARSHALLLLQKLLNLRDSASPLTLLLDSLEQSSGPVIREFMLRAKAAKSKVIFVSFATLRKARDVDVFVKARGKSLAALQAEIISHYPRGGTQKILLIIDVLNPLLTSLSLSPALHLPSFLSSLITGPGISLVGTYHTDVPLVLSPPPPSSSSSSSPYRREYEPHPLSTLSHLATAILRGAALAQEAARRRARDRSRAEPGWGLGEGREGVLVGLRGGNAGLGTGEQGLVLEMELRRRSGRAVVERFALMPPGAPGRERRRMGAPLATPDGGAGGADGSANGKANAGPPESPARICLLADHPAFADPGAGAGEGKGEDGEGEMETTFSLGLTEKQRRDREGVVLPYFDAQTDIGGGEGGRILYEMGREDDFDDEEDEI
ncbi:hypothetical protein DL764_003738 [Monosporascus ibericus]|uniref:Elongator complex protein 5 n=1 Tax=Monosporascus ibericus TaxID=155417 RepID=A0A4Q4TFH1_9PEZI|nr:hypothetical protein DL764_003738 [Monosporascus ibericus]